MVNLTSTRSAENILSQKELFHPALQAALWLVMQVCINLNLSSVTLPRLLLMHMGIRLMGIRLTTRLHTDNQFHNKCTGQGKLLLPPTRGIRMDTILLLIHP